MLRGAHLYAVASAGVICALDIGNGDVVWRFDVGKHSQTTPELLATPALLAGDGTDAQLILGTGLHYSISCAALVYCLRVPGDV